jgi:hypothetical protein
MLAGLLLLCFSLASVVLQSARGHWPPPFYVDCSTLPPSQAFQMIVGRSVPRGVTDIQGAGCPQGGYVWLRFRATDAAISSLTGGKKPDAFSIDDGLAGLLTWPDPRRVRWEEALCIRKPECYEIRVGPNPSVDRLTVVVDRKRHLVYVERFFL